MEEQEDGTFNFGKFRFEIIEGRKDAVIGLVLSGTSDRTFVTDEQIVCATAELITESRPYFERRALIRAIICVVATIFASGSSGKGKLLLAGVSDVGLVHGRDEIEWPSC